MKNYSIANMDIGKQGPCMVAGHLKEHVLEMNCWSTMRRFLYNHTFQEFLDEVNRKK